jgi:hypothetical protein
VWFVEAFQFFRQSLPGSRAVVVLCMDQHYRCIRFANGSKQTVAQLSRAFPRTSSSFSGRALAH